MQRTLGLCLATLVTVAPACGPRGGGLLPPNPDASTGDAGTLDQPPSGDGSTSMDSSTQPPQDVTAQPDGAPLPNLSINGPRIRSSARFEFREFGASSCDLREGCITTPGRRRLLRFDLETPNNGMGDAYLGRPRMPDERFEFSTCHGHRHFRGYAVYSLRNASNAEVARGHKQSFCLEDSRRTGAVANARMTGHYGCNGEQGISSGWSDVYGANLDCQYIDVTDVPPGMYTINVRINVNRGIVESDYSDNEVSVPITIPAAGDAGTSDGGATTEDVLAPCMGNVTGPDRNCGWTLDGTRTCTAGAMVTVGCNARCMPALGSCTGDAMIRVCPGSTACTNADALAANDDSCGDGNLCAQTPAFACPASGRYTVLTGSYDNQMYTCTIATR